MKLDEIANITIGLILDRKKASDIDDKYKYKLFTMKSYEEKRIKEKYDTFYSNEKLSKVRLVSVGDLIIQLKYPLKVVYVTEDLKELLIPKQYAILKIKDKGYSTSFLKWYLESDMISKEMLKNAKSGLIPIISLQDIKNINVPNINIKEQQQIGNIMIKWNRQKELMEDLVKEKDLYYRSYIRKYIGGNKNGE